MTSLFLFDDKVHCRSLSRAESTPLLFPRLLCQVLEHIGFPDEPRLEHRRDSEVSLTVDQWRLMPRSLPFLAEDQPAADIPPDEKLPPVEHIGEPQALTPSVPASPHSALVPPAPLPSVILGPHGPSTVPTDSAAVSTSVPPPQGITISTRDFLTIMDAVRMFSTTAASFAIAHVTLTDRMTRTEATMAQTSAIITQN